jgi:hypothetical protein
MVGFPAETVLHLNETREMTMLPVINVEKRGELIQFLFEA